MLLLPPPGLIPSLVLVVFCRLVPGQHLRRLVPATVPACDPSFRRLGLCCGYGDGFIRRVFTKLCRLDETS
jgi:hypothetical protein